MRTSTACWDSSACRWSRAGPPVGSGGRSSFVASFVESFVASFVDNWAGMHWVDGLPVPRRGRRLPAGRRSRHGAAGRRARAPRAGAGRSRFQRPRARGAARRPRPARRGHPGRRPRRRLDRRPVADDLTRCRPRNLRGLHAGRSPDLPQCPRPPARRAGGPPPPALAFRHEGRHRAGLHWRERRRLVDGPAARPGGVARPAAAAPRCRICLSRRRGVPVQLPGERRAARQPAAGAPVAGGECAAPHRHPARHDRRP